jgi:hypothetical protein
MGVAWQAARGLGGHLGADTLKKPAKGAHLSVQCVTLVS